MSTVMLGAARGTAARSCDSLNHGLSLVASTAWALLAPAFTFTQIHPTPPFLPRTHTLAAPAISRHAAENKAAEFSPFSPPYANENERGRIKSQPGKQHPHCSSQQGSVLTAPSTEMSQDLYNFLQDSLELSARQSVQPGRTEPYGRSVQLGDNGTVFPAGTRSLYPLSVARLFPGVEREMRCLPQAAPARTHTISASIR